MGTVAGLLLAAGAGTRYGMPKALVPTHDGTLLVERGLRTLRDSGCAPVIVVLGASSEEVRAKANLTGAVAIINNDWLTGMGSSLRTGLQALEPTLADSAAVLLVDTPGITPEAVKRISSHGAADALVAATYNGHLGHPVLLGRKHWGGVIGRALGDRGARPYLRAHADELTLIACDDVADGRDMDTPGALDV